MLTRMLAVGLLAGALSGALTAAIEHFTTVPLILEAEVYEKAAEKAAKPEHTSFREQDARLILVHDHGEAGPAAEAGAWEPADGIERTAYASIAVIGAAVGFSLMLLAAMVASGADITTRSATLWGLAGFVAVGLAPSLGLSPELPGSAAADLTMRQLWWIGTAAATAGGIWLMFRKASALWVAVGLLLIASPHIVGAPQPSAFTSTAPAELAAHFTSTSLVVHALLWTVTGALTGFFWQRMKPSAA
jgi:cobalt transporter subunit CbtA